MPAPIIDADASIKLPYSLIEQTVTEVLKSGRWCNFGFMMPYRCGNPALSEQARWGFGLGNLADQQECLDVNLPGPRPGGGFEREGPYVSVDFGGSVTVSREFNRFGDERPVLSIPVALRFQAAGLLDTTVRIVFRVGFRASFDDEHRLKLVLDPQTTQIEFLSGKEEAEELMCDNVGALDQLARETILGLVVQMSLSPIILNSPINLPIPAMAIAVSDIPTLGDRSMNIPFELVCENGDCGNGLGTTVDCPGGSRFEQAERRCISIIPAGCHQDLAGELRQLKIDYFGLKDICVGPVSSVPARCWGEVQNIVREGVDGCRYEYLPTYRFLEE